MKRAICVYLTIAVVSVLPCFYCKTVTISRQFAINAELIHETNVKSNFVQSNNSVISSDSTYKPVVIIHGVWDIRFSLNFMAQFIRNSNPGTAVHVLDILHGWQSLTPLWYQVKKFYDLLKPIMDRAPHGINLIGYSQGGLVARAILETLPHNVKTFISLSSPQAGQFGDAFMKLLFPAIIKEEAYELFYTKTGQKLSVGNYWNDPHHRKLYLKYVNFLPVINNEFPNDANDKHKNGFLQLQQIVLIGGPDDGVITPWQSSHFSFYNASEQVVDFRNRELYVKDTFGLKTLDEREAIAIFAIPGVKHTKWHHSVYVINKCILPYLK